MIAKGRDGVYGKGWKDGAQAQKTRGGKGTKQVQKYSSREVDGKATGFRSHQTNRDEKAEKHARIPLREHSIEESNCVEKGFGMGRTGRHTTKGKVIGLKITSIHVIFMFFWGGGTDGERAYSHL